MSLDVLAAGVRPRSVMSICRPFDQLRAFATCRKRWPAADPICGSQTIEFDDYLALVGGDSLVIDILVGDLQRIIEYAARGYAFPQPVSADVHERVRAATRCRLHQPTAARVRARCRVRRWRRVRPG